MDHLIQIGGSIKDATVIVENAQREFAEGPLSTATDGVSRRLRLTLGR